MTSQQGFEGGRARSEDSIARVADHAPGLSKPRCNNSRSDRPIAIVERRVDALYASFKGPVRASTRCELDLRTRECREARTNATATLGNSCFVLDRRSRDNWSRLENDHLAAVYNGTHAVAGWNLQVEVRAQTIASVGHWAALDIARSFAGIFLQDVEEERLRRFDLCADLANFDLRSIKIEQWLTPRRSSKSQRHFVQHNDRSEPTGWTFAHKPIRARIYDKREQLSKPSPKSDENRIAEEARWRANGWNGEDPVTRVEVQNQGEALDELGVWVGAKKYTLRDPVFALGHLDASWSYFIEKWLRLMRADDRSALDPRWTALQNVVFDAPAAPLPRSRERSRARALIVASNAIAYNARTGALQPPDFGIEAIDSWTSEDARHFLETTLRQTLAASAEGAIGELIEEFSTPHGAARHIFSKIKVALVRAGRTQSTESASRENDR